jgi:hypothetical protein
MKHRFVIGIGSQRAGSTLLHRLLEASTNVFMHPVKELHYFDTLYGVRAKEALKDYSLRQMAREVEKIVSAKDLAFLTKKKYKCYLRTNRELAMVPIERVNYLDLFRPCVMGHPLLGEVTPEYMLLDDVAIEKMKQVVGEDAAIILICRNPVKRLLSAVKLMNSYNNLKMDNVAAGAWLERMMNENTSWMMAQDKYNDYQTTIERYSKHFPHFIAISYDQMVTEPVQTAEKMAKALNIKINPEVFKRETGKVVNNLGGDFEISGEILKLLQLRYQDKQHFLDKLFGQDQCIA